MSANRLFLTLLVALPLEGCLGLEYFLEDTGFEADVDVDVDVDADTDVDVDTDTDAPPIDIDSIEPNYGTNGGGSIVEIRGGPFDQSVQVMFGNAAGSILQVNPQLLRVQTPVTSQEGLVNVTITTEKGAGQLDDGFTYWPDATGMSGAIGELRWIHWLGSYWDPSPPEDSGWAWWALIQPNDEHFYHWAFSPTDDSCASNYFYSNTLSNYNIGASTTSWDVNGRTLNLNDTNGNQLWEKTLTPSEYVQGASYHLNEISGNGFPSFGIENITQAPSSFVVTNPYLDGSTPPTVSRGFTVNWSGTTADRIVLILERMDAAQNSLETLTCVARNDGSFSVPASAWSGWQAGGIVFIFVGALNEGGGGKVPFNNAESRVSSTYFLAGGAWTQ